MQRRPGEVWFLSPEAYEGGDEKARRHVLLTSVDKDEGGVLAYASTQSTEAAFGAAFLDLDPAISRNSGFSKPTRIYPARLVLAASEDFLRMAGRLDDELVQLRSVLRVALGLGTGCAPASVASRLSWRGAVVRLRPNPSNDLAFKFAIVLTEHRYSSRKRYQIVVPLEDRSAVDPLAGDLLVSEGDWLTVLNSGSAGAILAVNDIQSVFHLEDVAEWTGVVVDDSTMNAIEAALKDRFEL